MKKLKTFIIAAALVTVAGCGTMPGMGGGTGTTQTGSATGDILGAVLNDVLTGGTLSNVITSVIGAQTVTKQNLIGTWKYSGPGCAFTSENLLAKAGGEVAAAQVKQKLQPYYQKIGINSSNT